MMRQALGRGGDPACLPSTAAAARNRRGTTASG